MKKIFLVIFAIVLGSIGILADINRSLMVGDVRYEIYERENNGVINRYAIVLPLEDYSVPNRKLYKGHIKIASQIKYGDVTYDVASVGKNAFRDCIELTEVVLPETIHDIQDYAFADCGNVRISQLSSIESIKPYAFSGTNPIVNTNLTKLDILYEYAFSGCGIKNVTFGPELFMLQTYALIGSDIENIYFTNDELLVENELQIAAHAVTQLKLRELRLPVKKLSLASEFCYDCPELERVIFPNIDYIGALDDFYTTSGIEGRFTKTNNLIYECPKMKEVIVMSPNPPIFYKWVVTYLQQPLIIDDYTQCVLKVPQGSEELYRADPVWGRFERIEGFAPGEYSGIEEAPVANVEPESAPVYYNLQGMHVKEPVKGQLYIRRTGSKTTKMVY